MTRRLKQAEIDRIRWLYDTTACSIARIARSVGVSPPTATKYIEHRDICPSPPTPDSARWSGPSNNAANRGP